MRFSSIESILAAALGTFQRFPAAMLCAWLAAASSGWLIFTSGKPESLTAVLLAATLGIPLFVALALLCERLDERLPAPSARMRWVLHAIGLVGLVAFALAWPHWSDAVQMRRYLQISVFVHTLAAVLPYMVVRKPNGFWQYNRTLFERLILATLFSGVLLGGLVGALAGLKPLFGISITSKAYSLLTVLIYFVLHPWMFLAGLPRDLAALEQRTDYPPAIRVFAQFILVPLVAVYQALLTAYLVRVILTGQWPSGVIGWLVSTVATVGVLAILLVHPVREREENRWVRVFARGFYIALVPSIGMLALSIGKRIGQYGFTEDRYFVAVLTAWLAAIALYFTIRREGDIRWIPITLGGLAIVTLGGPWSAYSVARASQSHRLAELLRTNGMLANGEARRAARDVPSEAEKELTAVLSYLLGTHGSAPVRAVMGRKVVGPDSATTRPNRATVMERVAHILGQIGLEYVPAGQPDARSITYAPFEFPDPHARPITGFDHHVHISTSLPFYFTIGANRWGMLLDSNRRVLILTQGADSLCTFALDPVIAAARRHGAGPSATGGFAIEGSPAGFATLFVTQLHGSENPGLMIQSMGAELYIKERGR